MGPTEPAFWEQRYQAGRMPWDLGRTPPALTRYLEAAGAEKGRVLIPGCGSGYEVETFRRGGWEPLAIDFSPAAVERARTVLGAGAAPCVREGDFFAGEFGRDFALVYERTFLCSMPPERWPDCARRVAELLRPGGALVGLFVYGEEPEPPPFPIRDLAAARALFGRFELETDEIVPAEETLPLFAGREHWQVWRLR
ncbi:MAG: methyltransferase domain-containing protein [Verrucomicrobiota bacterium]